MKRLAITLALLLSALAVGCTNEAETEPGDKPADAGPPNALGHGLRIAEMNDPDSSVRPANNQMNVYVTGATFLILDTFNETGTASGVGAVYVQDFSPPDAGGTPPYSGIQLYKPAFNPASLVLAAGDVIDLTGEYQEYFGPDTPPLFGSDYQPEMYEPTVTFRFDYSPPSPTVVPITDLESYATGYPWMSMLVTVFHGVSGGFVPGSGGIACEVTLDGTTNEGALAMDNELFDLDCTSPMYKAGTKLTVTGIVTYFESFTISPRSAADIVVESSDGG
jgi:hypothetical protein